MKLITLIVCLFITTGHLSAEGIQKLTVTGSSTLFKPADKLTISMGVATQDQKVDKAMQANREKMNGVIEELKKIGLSDKEYQTSSYTIQPKYSSPPKNPPPEWMASIVGYEVRNTITINTNKMEMASHILDTIGTAGANIVTNISFSLQDEQKGKQEAIRAAISQARNFADTAAKEAGVTIANVLELSVNSPTGHPVFLKSARFAAEASTPITPVEVEVSADVTIVYGIK